MAEISLFEHNEIAYNKLCEALKTNRCATINHATGTGKSFIALKYLYNNRDKKYLYIAPTYPIIEQLKQSCYKIGITPKDLNIDTLIYRNLLTKDMDKLYEKYDGIIFDEYHRVGAKKTYKKIKELKNKLANSNDDKKYIGLTATPIRFLDHERNMTKEVFDNVVASTLPLSDAMIDGLLPVPIYINSKISCRKAYKQTLKKVNEYPLEREKAELLSRLSKIGNQIDNGYIDNAEMINKYITEKNGKYIIFCSDIAELNKYYDEVDKWFSKIGKVKKYKVHSGFKKETNQNRLDEFNLNKDGISILLCVDVLNEGIHVDDIDGVFLLRRTISPIIYFQQIGRALSFSGRNREIKIFDLVNNYQNHNAIDLVYKEYIEEINKRIKEHPEKKQEYTEKLNRFKIKTETDDIMKELEEINKKVSKEGLINAKVEYAITILEEMVKETEDTDVLLNDSKALEAYSYLSKYYKYVTTEQFNRLQSLDIILPIELSYTKEERERLVKGYNTIHEKEKNLSNIVIKELIQFIQTNGRNVKINADNEKEKNLSMKYLYFLPLFNKIQVESLKQEFEKNNIPFSSYEKALLGVELDFEDIDDIERRARKFTENKYVIPEYLLESINTVIYNYDVEQNIKLLELLDLNKEISKKLEEEKKTKKYEKINEIIDLLEGKENLTKQELKELGIFEKIDNLSIQELNYLRQKYLHIKKKQYKELIGIEKKDEIQEFRTFIKEQNEENLEQLLYKAQRFSFVYSTMEKYTSFINKNKGKIPDINSNNSSEKELATLYKSFIDNCEIQDIMSLIKSDESGLLPKPYYYLNELFEKKHKNALVKQELLYNQYLRNKRWTVQRLI